MSLNTTSPVTLLVSGARGASTYDIWVGQQPAGADTSVAGFLASMSEQTVVFATLAALNANLNYAANTGAQVIGDATPANNGLYEKLGAAGAGSWTRIGSVVSGLPAASNSDTAAGGSLTEAVTPAGLASVLQPIRASAVTAAYAGGPWGSYRQLLRDSTGTIIEYVDQAGARNIGDLVVAGTVSGPAFAKVLEQSASSIVIGPGEVAFQTPPKISYTRGQRLRLTSRSTGFYVEGVVKNYNSLLGSGYVNLYCDDFSPLGQGQTLADWSISRGFSGGGALAGIGAPANTFGQDHQLYYRTDTGATYLRVSGVWRQIASLILDSTSIYVSAVSANSIPIGSDSTGNGTAAAPYLTLGKALSLGAGLPIKLNGVPGAPSVYNLPAADVISATTTIHGVLPYCATITSSAASFVFDLQMAAGQVLTIGQVIIDGLNATAAIFNVHDSAGAYSVALSGTQVQNWTAFMIQEAAGSASTQVNLSLTNVTASAGAGGTVQGGIYLNLLSAGSVSLFGSSIALTNHVTANQGCVTLAATSGGVTYTEYDCNLTVSLSPTLTGPGFHWGVQTLNIAAHIACSYHLVIGAYGARQGAPVYVSATQASPLASSALVYGCTLLNGTTGGYCIRIGEEDAYQAPTGNVTNLGVTWNYLAGAGTLWSTLEALFIGSRAGGVAAYNYLQKTGYACCDKVGNVDWRCNIILDAYNGAFTLKGSNGAQVRHNSVYQKTAGGSGQFIEIDAYNVAGETIIHTSSCVVEGNCFVSAIPGSFAVYWTDLVNGAAFSYNNYSLRGAGTWGANRFATGASGAEQYYTGAAAWIAAQEPTGLSVDPGWADPDGVGDFSIGRATPMLGTVPVISGLATDYSGRPFGAPATAGAYEAIFP